MFNTFLDPSLPSYLPGYLEGVGDGGFGAERQVSLPLHHPETNWKKKQELTKKIRCLDKKIISIYFDVFY